MKRVGLYVHVPFCSGKCGYCDFVSGSGRGAEAGRYLGAIEAEARLRPGFEPQTLYIGGGTPTELSASELAGLLAIVRRSFPTAGIQECTVEANPESLSPEKLAVLEEGGVTRLSLGLQTTDDRLLKRIGRRHLFADFARAFWLAREARLDVSVDLMFGLPGQTLEGFRASLDAVLALEPEHLSVYGLDVHEDTPFGREGVSQDEDLGRSMFELVIRRAKAAGYHHYEISNFALPGHESLHNQIYWNNGEYLGLGAAAVSCLGGERSSNAPGLEDYCSEALAGRRPVVHAERLSGKEKLGETLMLGLRLLDGVELPAEAEAAFTGELASLLHRGLILREGLRVRLSSEGLFFANVVASEFVAPFAVQPGGRAPWTPSRMALADMGATAGRVSA
ncbi:MAG: radical SAM family heme chaperone HemW [Elusimicrobia bacterium]|nr:radical SAM family heme chaperone HemW [Elusimicrobiota bacterium]